MEGADNDLWHALGEFDIHVVVYNIGKTDALVIEHTFTCGGDRGGLMVQFSEPHVFDNRIVVSSRSDQTFYIGGPYALSDKEKRSIYSGTDILRIWGTVSYKDFTGRTHPLVFKAFLERYRDETFGGDPERWTGRFVQEDQTDSLTQSA